MPILSQPTQGTSASNGGSSQAKIEELTGIKRSPSQIQAFLKRIGLRHLKVGFIPGKGATPEKLEEQETFRQQTLEPLLAEAKAGERALFLSMLLTLFIGLLGIYLVFCSHFYSLSFRS